MNTFQTHERFRILLEEIDSETKEESKETPDLEPDSEIEEIIIDPHSVGRC